MKDFATVYKEHRAYLKLRDTAPDMLQELRNCHEYLLGIYNDINNGNLDATAEQQSLRDRMAAILTLIDKATN